MSGGEGDLLLSIASGVSSGTAGTIVGYLLSSKYIKRLRKIDEEVEDGGDNEVEDIVGVPEPSPEFESLVETCLESIAESESKSEVSGLEGTEFEIEVDGEKKTLRVSIDKD